ncbi:hypothetical protein [Nocardia sp. NPDC049526]|uniref:hypothetical protein n=1 Tax=Nocardia sp. NPDC049526 TaxID=3364316 RepID=UPI0037AE7272
MTQYEPVPPIAAEQAAAGFEDAHEIGRAMAEEPHDRPASAAAFGDELHRTQYRHGLPVEDMAIPARVDVAHVRDRVETT